MAALLLCIDNEAIAADIVHGKYNRNNFFAPLCTGNFDGRPVLLTTKNDLNMEFNPNNTVIKLCLQGMAMEEKGNAEQAHMIFLQAWNEASNDFEHFLAAYYLARQQVSFADRVKWYETALQLATGIDDIAVKSALPNLYTNIANCYEGEGDTGHAEKYRAAAILHNRYSTDKGPFYHGTRANLQPGDMLTAGRKSNYKEELLMNHIYFTAMANGAGLAAALAKGAGSERVYIVEPTGTFENDPNVTDKKFPGNPTRSYRTTEPLKIVGELAEWIRQTPEEVQKWRERLDESDGEIIN